VDREREGGRLQASLYRLIVTLYCLHKLTAAVPQPTNFSIVKEGILSQWRKTVGERLSTVSAAAGSIFNLLGTTLTAESFELCVLNKTVCDYSSWRVILITFVS